MTRSSDPKSAFPNIPAPPGSKPASAYARFIPREELGKVDAWRPDSLGGVERRTEPRPEGAGLPSADEWRAKVNTARQSGYQDGYRDGLVALDSFKQSFAAQMSAQIGALVLQFDDQIGALEQQMASGVAQAAVALARQVLRHELQARPELVATIAQEAVNAVLMSARHIVVRVHPDDLALVSAGAAEVLSARGARLVADAAVQRGGCAVDSDAGSIDAGIERRWARAAAALGGGAELNAIVAADAAHPDPAEGV